DEALRKVESLIDSRQLFLRTIMHELKTPIGKGKILNTFIEEDKLKDGYDEVFGRLELLLNEFSKIEQMLSSNYELHLANYNAIDLVEQALELMIMDEDALEEQVEIIEESPLILSTDFTLFPLALKNLIDNAIKYAPDHHVEIHISKEGITVSNKGAQFTDQIENYFKPFHGKGEGLGLGLYIVHNIMEMLKLKLTYSYVDNKNSFSIITLSI
ncbi:MAG: sensor histidine kinase, partial [Sulfurovum sp.]|nr:sensor histidine kinase [Sulfurovum sp.]NNJ45196.1 sensor histidine kinase [Sulfurovum sp.]